MNIKDIDILTIIPQRHPFVMIDRLQYHNDTETSSSFFIKKDNIFCENELLREGGILENIAQTCAARIGYINKYEKHEKIKIGLIGSVKDFVVNRMPAANSTIFTKIRVMSEVFAITLIEAEVTDNDGVIAHCEINISLTDKEFF